jgi:hypothetical protein
VILAAWILIGHLGHARPMRLRGLHPSRGGRIWTHPSSQRSQATRVERERGVREWIFGQTASVLTLVGLLLYGANRYAYEMFYGSMAVTPEEVGLTYPQVLAQTATGFLLIAMGVFALLAIYSTFMSVLWTVTWVNAREARTEYVSAPRKAKGFMVLGALAFFAGVVGLVALLTHFLPSGVERLVFALAMLAALAQVFREARAYRAATGSSWVPRPVLYFSGLLSVALTIALTLLTALASAATVTAPYSNDDGGAEASDVNEDTPIEDGLRRLLFGNSLTVEPAQVQPISSRNAGGVEDLPSCALYLGAANGLVVIYDAAEQKSWRLPSSAVSITLDTSRDSCADE